MPTYLVTVPTTPPTERLVEAANTASARNHVARSVITATVAKGPDLFRIAKAGGEIEQAGATAPEPEPQPQPPKNDGEAGEGNDTKLGGQEAEPPAAEDSGKPDAKASKAK